MTRANSFEVPSGMVQVTEWCLPGTMVPTVVGNVEYGEWVRREGERVQAAGRRIAMVENGQQLALFAEPADNLRTESSERKKN